MAPKMGIRGSIAKEPAPDKGKQKATTMQKTPYTIYGDTNTGNWVPESMLAKYSASIYRGYFYTEEEEKIRVIRLTRSFFEMQSRDEFKPLFKRLGLWDYMTLPAWGVDLKRAWQLLSTITESGSAKVDDLDDQKLEIKITAERVRAALHFKPGKRDASKRHPGEQRETIFAEAKKKQNTFSQMVYEEVVPPLKIFLQHFKMVKSERYTVPDVRLAYIFSDARESKPGLDYDWGDYIYKELIEVARGLKKTRDHLAGGHFLTRLAYFAIGAVDQLPPCMTAASAVGSIETAPRKNTRDQKSKAPDYESPERENMSKKTLEELLASNKEPEDEAAMEEGDDNEDDSSEGGPKKACEERTLQNIYKTEERMCMEGMCTHQRQREKKRKREQEKKVEMAAEKKTDEEVEVTRKEKRTNHRNDQISTAKVMKKIANEIEQQFNADQERLKQLQTATAEGGSLSQAATEPSQSEVMQHVEESEPAIEPQPVEEEEIPDELVEEDAPDVQIRAQAKEEHPSWHQTLEEYIPEDFQSEFFNRGDVIFRLDEPKSCPQSPGIDEEIELESALAPSNGENYSQVEIKEIEAPADSTKAPQMQFVTIEEEIELTEQEALKGRINPLMQQASAFEDLKTEDEDEAQSTRQAQVIIRVGQVKVMQANQLFPAYLDEDDEGDEEGERLENAPATQESAMKEVQVKREPQELEPPQVQPPLPIEPASSSHISSESITVDLSSPEQMMLSMQFMMQRFHQGNTDLAKEKKTVENQLVQVQQRLVDQQNINARLVTRLEEKNEKNKQLNARLADMERRLMALEQEQNETRETLSTMESLREVEKANYIKLQAVHRVSNTQLKNTQALLDQICTNPTSFSTPEEVIDGSVLTALRLRVEELDKELAAEKLQRDILAKSFLQEKMLLEGRLLQLEKADTKAWCSSILKL